MTHSIKDVREGLRNWGRWTQQPKPHFARSVSIFGRIREMHENAGISGDGIRYDLVEVDGEAVMCKPDGGMADMVDRIGEAMAHDLRCRLFADAVANLPGQQRSAISIMYVVPLREDPRSIREVARQLERDESTVREAVSAAHRKVGSRVYGTFEVTPSNPTEPTQRGDKSKNPRHSDVGLS
eukprot:TRINITY_DN21361_c0_g1_i1.p1 TRINITY_DN21361_c0_g1~~TRINITY_DN21361_c0_g1_i1.p1  ORF type:complete len:182 (-),score=35.40 TRINITY_DN21361_c0_g1_i1:346-891(-)